MLPLELQLQEPLEWGRGCFSLPGWILYCPPSSPISDSKSRTGVFDWQSYLMSHLMGLCPSFMETRRAGAYHFQSLYKEAGYASSFGRFPQILGPQIPSSQNVLQISTTPTNLGQKTQGDFLIYLVEWIILAIWWSLWVLSQCNNYKWIK